MFNSDSDSSCEEFTITLRKNKLKFKVVDSSSSEDSEEESTTTPCKIKHKNKVVNSSEDSEEESTTTTCKIKHKNKAVDSSSKGDKEVKNVGAKCYLHIDLPLALIAEYLTEPHLSQYYLEVYNSNPNVGILPKDFVLQPDDTIENNVDKMHNLSDLFGCDFTSFTPGNYFDNLPINLSSLDLSGCCWIRDIEVALIPVNSPYLSYLDISGCSKVTDKGIQQLTQLCYLQGLNISYNSSITLHNISSFSNLTRLIADHCSKLKMYKLSKLTQCAELSLEGNRFTVRDIDTICSMISLQRLNLTDTNFEHDRKDDSCVKITQLTNLLLLNLAGSDLFQYHSINYLQDMVSLVDFTPCSRDDDDEDFLSNLSNLTRLDLTHIYMSAENLDKLPNKEKITTFILNGQDYNHKCINLRQFVNVTELDLSNNYTTIQFRDELPYLTQLKKLDLSTTIIHTSDFLQVVGKLTTLVELDLSESDNGHSDFPYTMHNLLQLKCLTHLILIQSRIINDEDLFFISHITILIHLNLEECSKITTEGISHLTTLTQLEFLDISKCDKVHGPVFKHIGKLSSLQILNMANTASSGEDIVHLGKLTFLVSLNIDGCKNKKFKFLSSLLYLEDISLKNTNIDNKGIKIVSLLPRVHTLYLAKCKRVTDPSMKYISNMQKLKELDIEDCTGITEIGVKEILLTPHLQTLSNYSVGRTISDKVMVLLKKINLSD
jgi:Leucine-rich repeat (LRR) protein